MKGGTQNEHGRNQLRRAGARCGPGDAGLARVLLGQVMGFVSFTVGFTALGAYLGRDLSGGTGLVLFIGALVCVFVHVRVVRLTAAHAWEPRLMTRSTVSGRGVRRSYDALMVQRRRR